jgi:glutathione S-transferase
MNDPFLLVGMLDSPFVRRVAIALELYGMAYTSLPLRTVGDAEEFAAYSPLKRAPTLVLPGRAPLFDSHLILEHLDELVAPDARLTPASPSDRLLCRQVMGVACGIADKAVSAVYEKVFHPVEQRSARVLDRIRGQLADSVAWLEARAPERDGLFGARLSHGDIVVGTAMCFALEAHPDLVDLARAPRLVAWTRRLEARPEFVKTYLALEPPR